MSKMFIGCSPLLNLHLPNSDGESADALSDVFNQNLS